MPTISLSLDSRSYDIVVENNLLSRVGSLLAQYNIEGRIALVTDSTVEGFYAFAVEQSLLAAGYDCTRHVFPAGEQSKNLATVEALAESMVQQGHDRGSVILALGGGVVGDMAGFLAAIYYRGIPFVQVPTTVMAQVDSSVGGKTAVDIAAGKNLIGAFHQPRLVLVDPLSLDSLPARVIREGMAEMVKHAALRQPDMIPSLQQMGREIELGFSLNTRAALAQILADNIAIKARIVEADEEERLGIRALLNLGHTIGHGIEASLPYGEMLHGEAISYGLRAALYLSRRHVGLDAEAEKSILQLLKDIGLPLVLDASADVDLILKKTATDKKFSAGAVRFVLLHALGDARVCTTLCAEDLRDAIMSLKEDF